MDQIPIIKATILKEGVQLEFKNRTTKFVPREDNVNINLEYPEFIGILKARSSVGILKLLIDDSLIEKRKPTIKDRIIKVFKNSK